MRNSLDAESLAPQNVTVGVLEGRNCHSGSGVCEVCPKLIINFYLSGGQSFAIDSVQFSENADPCERPCVSMINIKRKARIYFSNMDSGARLRKVKMSIPLTWLEREIGEISSCSPALHDFLSTHLSHFVFEPTPDLIELAEQISRPPANLKGELLTLYRKSRAIELMRLACAVLVAQAGEIGSKPTVMNARQSERVRQYILSNLPNDLTIDVIARESGASASSVQRHFKQQYGMTVFEFIRRKRLMAARDALETKGVTVAEAAWIAGYISTSSFTKAFKKAYGTNPGEMRG